MTSRFEKRKNKEALQQLANDQQTLSGADLENKYPQAEGESSDQPARSPKEPRKLSPCPCGSRKKYRDCCRPERLKRMKLLKDIS